MFVFEVLESLAQGPHIHTVRNDARIKYKLMGFMVYF
jgi:hypothetical protein